MVLYNSGFDSKLSLWFAPWSNLGHLCKLLGYSMTEIDYKANQREFYCSEWKMGNISTSKLLPDSYLELCFGFTSF